MKVAINGCGIAGPTLAYWLHRAGHEPVLIERAPALRTGGYVIDFWGVGYTVAERMGILPRVLEAGYSIEEVRLVGRDDRRAGGMSADVFRRMTDGRFTSLPRGDLAAEIYRAVADEVETVFDDGISAVEEHEGGVYVSFERGAAGDFDLVIGADGLHSGVRGLVFGSEREFERHIGYRVAAFEVEGYRPRDELVYVSHTVPGRQLARFSMRGDRTLFLLVFTAGRMPGPDPRGAEAVKAVLRNVFGGVGWEAPQILEAMDDADEIYFDRVSQIGMESWSKGRVMLIGDAASCVSLLAGEGTGLAMTEAYVLAGELQRAGGDYRRAFERHEQRLRGFIEGKQKSARNFASAFAPRTALGVWFRNRVTRLMAVPAIADFMVGRGLRDDFDLPDYEP